MHPAVIVALVVLCSAHADIAMARRVTGALTGGVVDADTGQRENVWKRS